MALYNLDDIAAVGATNCSFEGAHHCEHVAFQQCLGAHGLKVAIAPSLVQGCGADHMFRSAPKLQRVHVDSSGAVSYPAPSAFAVGVSHTLGNLTDGGLVSSLTHRLVGGLSAFGY
eukprot:1085053-Prymnesium_polylepis.1